MPELSADVAEVEPGVESRGPHTRGFLFTDLRDYSAYTEAHGDIAAADLIRRYRQLVRTAIAGYQGAEIRTEGDSFYVVFGSVSQAVRAGLAIRNAAAEASGDRDVAPIRVGIGIHAGEVEEGAEGIVSSAVNIAARVCALAGGGEVLVTETVRSLTRTLLPISFEPRGRRRLKGITEAIPLFAVDMERGQSVVPRRGRVRIALAVTTIVGIAAVIALGMNARRSDVAASFRAPTPPALISPSAGPTENPFPNSAEAGLRDRLPEALVDRCERADPSVVPVEEASVRAGTPPKTFTTVIPLAVEAGLTCLTDQTRVTFWLARHASDIDAIFIQHIGTRSVPAGSCEELPRAWEPWQAGAYNGKVACSSAEGNPAAIEWTYGNEPIYAVATRHDGDAQALLSWWRAIGRLLGR
jgi:class 3 adenylate cyclase